MRHTIWTGMFCRTETKTALHGLHGYTQNFVRHHTTHTGIKRVVDTFDGRIGKIYLLIISSHKDVINAWWLSK